MSDYLTRLAERALGLAVSVQPRLPGRYAEPVVPAEAGGFTLVSEPGIVAPSPITSPPRDGVSEPAPRVGAKPVSARSVGAPERARDSLPESGMASPVVRLTEAVPANPLVSSPASTPISKPAVPPTGLASVAPAALFGAPPEATVLRTVPVPAAAVQPVAPEYYRPLLPKQTPPPIWAVRPAPAITAQPPTVRIHIGRVEVRASTGAQPEPVPFKSKPEPAPSLSLGDYLRRGRKPGERP